MTIQPNAEILNTIDLFMLRKARHNQIDIKQFSKTIRMTRTALTVALNN